MCFCLGIPWLKVRTHSQFPEWLSSAIAKPMCLEMIGPAVNVWDCLSATFPSSRLPSGESIASRSRPHIYRA
jgi:hypothetical protein